MRQVVVQNFELESIPQAYPRTTKHPIDKLAPQLTKGSFYLLAQLTEDEAVSRGAVASNQQHLGLFGQVRGTLGTAIAQITQGDSPIDSLDQSQRGATIIAIARRQDNIEHPSVKVAEERELKAKEPPLTALPKVRALVSQQADPPVPEGQTEGNRFAVDQIQAGSMTSMSTGGGQQSTNLGQQVV